MSIRKFIIIFLSVLLFSVYTDRAFALTSVTPSSNYNANTYLSPSPTPTPVDYTLPYPGILPTNFLYKLKAIRDRIIGFLISDPLKKADFNILQADKRYNASLYMFKENANDEDIISSTLSKADNYMEEAIGQLIIAKKQGQDVKDLTSKILLSNQKHLEVLFEIEKSASDSLKKNLIQEEGRISQIKNLVNTQLLHK